MKISAGTGLTWSFCAGAWAATSLPAASAAAPAAPVARKRRRVKPGSDMVPSLGLDGARPQRGRALGRRSLDGLVLDREAEAGGQEREHGGGDEGPRVAPRGLEEPAARGGAQRTADLVGEENPAREGADRGGTEDARRERRGRG